MISSEENDVTGEVQLDGEEEDADFDALDAAVDVVAEEEIVERTRFTCLGDHVEQVSVLTMDVANNADGLIDLHQVCFGGEHLQGLGEQTHDLSLRDGTLAQHELLQNFPVGHIVGEEDRVVDLPVDHAGALLVSERPIGERVRQQTEVALCLSFHHVNVR